MAERKIAAIALPMLQLEIANLKGKPAGIVMTHAGDERKEIDLAGNVRLHEVSPEARALGVRPGQTIAQARSRAAMLEVRVVREVDAKRTLERLAELLLRFGAPVSFDASTLYVDVTTSAHLFADPEREIARAVREAGHACSVAIDVGPTIARARAHFGPDRRLDALPLEAIGPELGEALSWLARLGFSRVGDLSRAPRRGLGNRLGERAPRVLALLDGIDPAPLRPYVPPEVPEEKIELEYGTDSSEAIVFVAKAACERLAQRLEGRGMQTSHLELVLALDKALSDKKEERITCILPAPMHRASDLLVVLRARIEHLALSAPVLGVLLRAKELSPQEGKALHLFCAESKAELHLPRIAAEISALVGEEHAGTLEMVDSHDPSLRTRLVPIARERTKHADPTRLVSSAPEPLRWLVEPIVFEPSKETKSVLLVRTAYLEWWRSRDVGSVDTFARWDARGELACVRDGWVVGWMG